LAIVDHSDMLVGEDYARAWSCFFVRVTLLETSQELRAAERALVRFREGSRKGQRDDVSIHARPLPIPRRRHPGVRRRAA
jgi:hypothetical protein